MKSFEREVWDQVDPDSNELFPYYKFVPKDFKENLKFREDINRIGANSEFERALILAACKRDLLFFINAILWIKREQPFPEDLPFITWPKQDDYVRLLVETRKAVDADSTNTVRGDTLCDKPRQVGWSWLTLAEGFQFIRFNPGASGIVGSRVEYDVDENGRTSTLFWKLDYFAENAPDWFMPRSYWSSKGKPTPSKSCRALLKMSIPGFGTMMGSATHEDFGRSGQFGWMMLDEFAHTDRGQQGMGDKIWTGTTKNCRVRRVVSTPKGKSNKFYSLRFSNSLPVFTVNWYDDPAKMIGGYTLEDDYEVGPVTLKAGDYWSPWAEASRKADDNDALFAQEVLLSYEGVGGCFYEGLLNKIKHHQVTEPVLTGNVKHRDDGRGPRIFEIKSESVYFFRAWEMPVSTGSAGVVWKPGRYVLGIDVASGSRNAEGRGASNSVVCIGRIEGTKIVKVAQYMTHGLAPHLFARIVCALGWCFCDTSGLPGFCIWECNGPGEIMGNCLLRELNYPGQSVYWEFNVKGSSYPGFRMQTFRRGDGTLAGSKVNVFNEHLAWLENGDYAEPSHDTYKEMEQYNYTVDGGAEHVRRSKSLSPSDGRENHGDSVIGTVLMVWAARELRKNNVGTPVRIESPMLSVDWAMKRRKKETSGLWR
ncbi:hypothetical protein [Nitrospira sp. BLG_1]|uniref:hypothetical protein n=1 Tax=Nitrospira sp. BLG_1 TaxID=3395883 RepID=UPI0039BCFD3A